MTNVRLCHFCETDISRRHRLALYCFPCGKSASGRPEAHNAIARAIARGVMPAARTLVCVDCSRSATDYDHRDYNAPLCVEPVCRSCNFKRGPALPVLARLPPNSPAALRLRAAQATA